MSAAPAAAADAIDATAVVPSAKGKKKKLILIGAALAVLLAAGGGGAVFVMKKRAATAAAAANAEDGEEAEPKEAAAAKPARVDLKHAPTFVPLEPFTVNLADREAERYAQVGITLELNEAKAADLLKAYMPAIRNNILLALGSKTAAQLIATASCAWPPRSGARPCARWASRLPCRRLPPRAPQRGPCPKRTTTTTKPRSARCTSPTSSFNRAAT
jgi:flagellar basal body-associated protein FliL